MDLREHLRLGFSMFPVRGKIPATRHGFKEASTTEAGIARLCSEYPDNSGIAVATGGMSGGLLVIDVDTRHNGDDTILELQQKYGRLPEGIRVKTPSGGRHYYLRLPPGITVRSRNGLWKGVDIKSEGGYVVAPPSTGYSWAYDISGEEVAPIPAVWLQAITDAMDKGSSAQAAGPGFMLPDILGEGERHDTMVRFAGQLRRGGLDTEIVYETLKMHNERRCKPPLEDSEIYTIAKTTSAWTATDAPVDVEKVEDTGQEIRGFVCATDVFGEMERMASLERVRTGFTLLDEQLGGGLLCTQHYILVGPTGHGKTSLATTMAVHMCKRRPVLFWTLEMAPGVIVAKVGSQSIEEGQLDIMLDVDLQKKIRPFVPKNLYFYEERSVDGFVLAVKRVTELCGGKAPVIIMDYLQKFAQTSSEPRADVARASETIRSVIKQLEIPAIVISSSSRAGAAIMRNSRTAGLDELVGTGKEAGDIEYDAAGVITVGLDKREEDEEPGDTRRAIVAVAKSRFGTEAKIEFEFEGAKGLWRQIGKPESHSQALEAKVLKVIGDGVHQSKNSIYDATGGKKRTVLSTIDRLVERGVLVPPHGGLPYRISEH